MINEYHSWRLRLSIRLCVLAILAINRLSNITVDPNRYKINKTFDTFAITFSFTYVYDDELHDELHDESLWLQSL